MLPLMSLTHTAFPQAQEADSTAMISHFSGSIFLTQNGISLVPTFSLDKPAVMFLLSMGKKRLTFEPDIRFSLEGKPWSMLLWWRYKLVQNNRFSLRVGAHPGFNFRTIPVVSNGKSKDVIETRRFLAGELVPSYMISKNVKIGMYYLFSQGFDDSQKYTHFLVLNSAFPNINLSEKFSLGIFPNVFYLRLDELEGYYASSTFRLYKHDFPLSLESIINQKIVTDILPERGFVWNVSLVYSFNKQFTEVRPGI